MSKYGLIYIVSNSEQKKNLFKIGKTSRGIEFRIKELNSATGTLGKFKAHATFLVEDIDETEKLIHKKLSKLRYQKNREFFESDYTELLLKIEELIGNECLKKEIFTELDKKKLKLIKDKKLKSEKEFLTTDFDMDRLLKDSIESSKNEKIKKVQNYKKFNDDLKKFSTYQLDIYKTNIEKLKKSLNKYKYIHFHTLIEKYSIDCRVVFSPNNINEINNSIKHHEKLSTPYKSDWGAINIDFAHNYAGVSIKKQERHYKYKDTYRFGSGHRDYIYNIPKVFKYLVKDFANLIINHKDLQLEEQELKKKFGKDKELTYSDYEYFVDRSFGSFYGPYSFTDRDLDDEDDEETRFSRNDCDYDHAHELFLKFNK